MIQPHRRIPFHLRQKVKDELQHLEDMDVIESHSANILGVASSRSTKTEQC